MNMKMFLLLSVVFTVVIGLFLGCMLTSSMNDWKRKIVTLAIAVCVGCCFSAMFCIERSNDIYAWNNDSCECGCEWKFSNVEHLKNSGNLYYWYCEDCGKVIELHTEFTK